MNKSSFSTRKLAMISILTVITVILQLLASFAKPGGVFSISLVLMPIVLGSALYGAEIGAWLGLVFGFTVLLSGDAAPFLAVSPLGTILVVLLKGSLAGYVSGAVFRLLKDKNLYLAIIAAAFVCPVINTGVFVIGCYIFFWDTIKVWASGLHLNASIYLFTVMIGINFIFEVITNMVLCPTILRLLKFVDKEEYDK